MKVSFLLAAEQEVDETIDYYEAQKQGLGTEFAEEIEATLTRISRYPEGWKLVGRNIRRCQMSRFPYGIIYRISENDREILIIAIAHLHRKPNYWRKRLR